MSELSLWFAALCSLAGSLFFLASAVGLLRLPDFYTRIHAPTKAATMGILLIALGSIAVHARKGATSILLEEAILILFVFLTVPVSSQMLIRAAAARRVPQTEDTSGHCLGEEADGSGEDPARL